jgi:hypothetical protein
MSIYKFRILIETDDEIHVIRDILIKSSQSFEDLHQIILKAYEFDNSQMASFYVSDDDWNKGQEIALFDMNAAEDEGEKILIMNETAINSQINCVGQHLLYTYDFLNMWNFFIELIEITVKEKEAEYPQIVYSEGDAPKQNSKNNELSNDEILNEFLNTTEENEDTFSDDIFEGFDDFDNYE